MGNLAAGVTSLVACGLPRHPVGSLIDKWTPTLARNARTVIRGGARQECLSEKMVSSVDRMVKSVDQLKAKFTELLITVAVGHGALNWPWHDWW